MRLLSTKRLAHEVPNSAPSLNERGSLQPDRHTPVTAKCPTHRIRVIALSICSQGTTKGFQLCYFKTFCRKFRKSWGKKTTKTTDIRVKVEHKRNLLKAKMQYILQTSWPSQKKRASSICGEDIGEEEERLLVQ
jgi:hypothetical protein